MKLKSNLNWTLLLGFAAAFAIAITYIVLSGGGFPMAFGQASTVVVSPINEQAQEELTELTEPTEPTDLTEEELEEIRIQTLTDRLRQERSVLYSELNLAKKNHTLAVQDHENATAALQAKRDQLFRSWYPVNMTAELIAVNQTELHVNYTLQVIADIEQEINFTTAQITANYEAEENAENYLKPFNLTKMVDVVSSDWDLSSKIINVRITQDCLDASYCPSYDDMMIYDTSNHFISGKFENGTRNKAGYDNSYKFYSNYPEFVVILDPPDFVPAQKTIYIVPNLINITASWEVPDKRERIVGCQQFGKLLGDTYFGDCIDGIGTHIITPEEYYESWYKALENKVFLPFEDRYVQNCTEAFISASAWHYLLPDTITFLRHGCDIQHTSYPLQEPNRGPQERTFFHPQSYEWKWLQHWVEKAETCKVKCL